MRGKILCLWIILGFFLANTIVLMVCHHIVADDNHNFFNNNDETTSPNINSITSMFSTSNGPNGLSKNNPTKRRRNQNNKKKNENHLPDFAICMLTRDDIPILPEWIAYHYHAVNMRHLVIGVDSLSETDPTELLNNFRKHLGGQDNDNDQPLIIEQWSDKDFMPDYFVRGEYGKSPNFANIHNTNPDEQTWEEYCNTPKVFTGGPALRKKKIADQTLVNNHRFRQTRFLSKCSEHLRNVYQKMNNKNNNATTPRSVWMAPIDSDEYLAVNPWIVQEQHETVSDSLWRLEQGSLLEWLVDSKVMGQTKPLEQKKQINPDALEGPNNCVQIPRLLFGAVELSAHDSTIRIHAHNKDTITKTTDTTHGFVSVDDFPSKPRIEFRNDIPRHSNKMETLRWKFHAAPNDPRNFQQKVVLDLLNIPPDDELWGNHVYTVHQPSRKQCNPESEDNFNGTLLVPSRKNHHNNTTSDEQQQHRYIEASPIMAYHYIGSEERYFARPDDFRRNKKRYRERSNITHARDETGWIDQWLERFVEHVGLQKASVLLSSYALEVEELVA